MCKAIDDLIKDSVEEGRVEGIEEGKKAGRMEAAFNMKNLGMSLDVIAKCVGVSEDTVRTWFATA